MPPRLESGKVEQSVDDIETITDQVSSVDLGEWKEPPVQVFPSHGFCDKCLNPSSYRYAQ